MYITKSLKEKLNWKGRINLFFIQLILKFLKGGHDRPWNSVEDTVVTELDDPTTDQDLSLLIQRTSAAIRQRRYILNQKAHELRVQQLGEKYK